MKTLIDSISLNPESEILPFFFFLDGGDLKAQKENERLIHEASLPHKFIIAREINYGCPKNHIDSKRFLFDWCHFDQIIVLEEDLLISRNYFKTLLALHDWATKNYSNIGTVQLWSKCMLTREDKRKYLSDVSEVALYWSLVTYCLRRSVWDDISPLLYRFEQFIEPFLGKEEYQIIRSKPGKGPTFRKYQTWIRKIVKQHDHQAALARFGAPQWHSQYNVASWFKNNEIPMNQDQITSFCIWLAGYTRLQTTVNRVTHIGKEGISSKNHKLNTQLDEFPEEENLVQFKRCSY